MCKGAARFTPGSRKGKAHVGLQLCFGTQVLYRFADALRWAIQIAEGLASLHGHDPLIIHRDIKLDNVLLSGGKSYP